MRLLRARWRAVPDVSAALPAATEMATLLGKGLQALPSGRLWVNPDCDLKTRGRPEVRASLENLVAAARQVPSLPPSPS